MKFFRLLLASLCACCLLAATATAAETKPSEKSLKQLLALTQARALVDTMIARTDGLVKNGVAQRLKGKELIPEQKQIIDQMVEQMIDVMHEDFSWESLEPDMLAIYRDSLSQEEVDGLIAFYKSKIGQAFVHKMPLIMQKTTEQMQQKMLHMTQKLQKIQAAALEKSAQLEKKETPPQVQ